MLLLGQVRQAGQTEPALPTEGNTVSTEELAKGAMKGMYRLWNQWRNSHFGWVKRNSLKAKTLGLIYHDRILTRDK